ncbi:exo-alpha-sialidase [Pontibacter diazotrophicus]|uniref:Exo-alpha-sialidase n=1 Tax=Pontibacter diazotrophicus TaxID=1400979 RepID=A0A3D8L6K3_9BACT|nr:sialidase family protein [Pontibacter diazotrophicus]RDV13050.1 exo-alpha-sialidase [Pontibacter diazotrophicus]
MKFLKIKVLVLLLGHLFLVSCKEDPKTNPVTPTPVTAAPDDLPPVDTSTPSLNITWEEDAMKMSHDVYFAEYGRAHRVKGDTVLFTYHFGPFQNEWDNIAIRRSIDGGNTWSEAETIVADDNPNYYGFANPELITLQNGDVILAYTGRGNPDDNAHANIQIRVSKDRGWTFGPPQIVATGRSWEPAMILLPDGEIELFYSSEARWWAGPGATAEQQEILMVRSTDNGATWSHPVQVAYTPGMRDGMAVPLVLQDEKGIVFPVESVNNTASPWIVWSSLEARWDYAGVGTIQNERRWLATREPIWGGAPFIIQLPTGETVLSVQDRGGRAIGSDWKKNTMLVLVGNSVAKNFTNISYPWPDLPLNEGAYYSSLFLKDPQTLVIITTRNYADGHSEVYWKEGHIQ